MVVLSRGLTPFPPGFRTLPADYDHLNVADAPGSHSLQTVTSAQQQQQLLHILTGLDEVRTIAATTAAGSKGAIRGLFL